MVIAKAGLDRDINQYFAVLTSTRTVGVMGDFRTYDYTLALRGVTTTDFMTADWARIPYDVLDTISRRIVNEVQHINRIVYDITSKPPATIEWEQSEKSQKWLKIRILSLLRQATGTKLGKDYKKNNLNNCLKRLAIEYKKSDRSLIVTVFLYLI